MNALADPHQPANESYAQRIWRHFQADSFARTGLRVVIALFIVAALAPFLANSHAIIRHCLFFARPLLSAVLAPLGFPDRHRCADRDRPGRDASR
jgi:ABC-type antimicrobial peptide transport system permease subunit